MQDRGTAIGTHAPDRVQLTALREIPQVRPGDDLAALVAEACAADDLELRDDDILVVAQKIVSKSEGRIVSLADVHPSEEARALARETGKPPAVVQLVLDESVSVVRRSWNVIIVEHRLGFVMANAGIDQSNAGDDQAILLPEDPDASARKLRGGIRAQTGATVGVIVSDSIGRAWRNGTVGHAIGVSGLEALLDLRGTPDLFGRPMQVTEVAIADEIAAAASMLMGQGNEARPVVIVRGFRLPVSDRGTVRTLIRAKELDLFR